MNIILRDFMKQNIISLIAIFALFVGCTKNFDDVLITDVNKDWKYELYSIIEDNKVQLDESGLSLLNFKLKSTSKLSMKDFFNDESLFPVYINNYQKRFELMPLRFVETDTLSIHYKLEYMMSMVNELLKFNDYHVIELEWLHNDERFYSTALFNQESGALEYDNILFNIISNRQRHTKSVITRSETPPSNPYVYDYDIVNCYSSDNTTIASVWINWYEYGKYYKSNPVYSPIDSSIIGYNYEFKHSNLICSFGEWKYNNASAIGSIKDYNNNCNSNTINFTYCIWVGPNVEKPNNPIATYVPSQNGSADLTQFSNYYGGLRIGGRVKNVYIQPSDYIIYK